jgi:hypothetical protein
VDDTGQARAARPLWQRLGSLGVKGVAVLAALVALVLLAVGFFAARGLDLFPSWGNPVGEQTVDRSERPLQLSLENLSEYHASSGTFQVVLDLERDRKFVPSFVSGERTIFLATGSVDGFVDFATVTPDRIVVDQANRSATITLPSPQLDAPTVDHEASRVLSRDRGLIERAGSVFAENPGSEGQFFQLAEQRLTEAAAQSDVRKRAEENTRAMLTSLTTSLGFDTVTVTFDPPPQ